MLAAPDWLYCTVPRWFISSGLAAMRPTHSCAILHLVECRSQFGSLGMLKAQRPHVQRAYGHWLLPPNASVTRSPLGAGLPPRALRLSLGARLASGADASILPILDAHHDLRRTADEIHRRGLEQKHKRAGIDDP